MTKRLQVDVEKCTECRTCELKCSFVHFTVYNLNKSGVRILSKWPETPQAQVCIQCDDPACLAVCPNESMELNDQGIVIVHYDECAGCENCVSECAYDGVWIDPFSNVAVKCDTCNGQFLCVADCFPGALSVVDN